MKETPRSKVTIRMEFKDVAEDTIIVKEYDKRTYTLRFILTGEVEITWAEYCEIEKIVFKHTQEDGRTINYAKTGLTYDEFCDKYFNNRSN